MKNTVIHLSQDCPRTGHVPGRGQDEDKRGQKKFHCLGKGYIYNGYKIKILIQLELRLLIFIIIKLN